MSTKKELATLRHSAAHILAQAVQELYPGTKLGIGPAIEDGFYYDFEREESFKEEDLIKIEKRMKEIIQAAYSFQRKEITREEALKFFAERNEKYKCELIREIPDEALSVYTHATFTDLCKGPHLKDSGQIGAVKLLSVAGAYWRGSERNPMLQRIYGTAFYSQKELSQYLKNLEEAKKRDHRKLGKELELFSFHEEAPGFPFYHPKGTIVINELLKYIREELYKEKYVEVKTPIILREDLWKRSGHFEHYKNSMYFTEMDNGRFAVKPMNCPGGLLIYKAQQHSYRELPWRVAEMGLVHRHELSGVLHGLFRVKAFTQDDAHIFCTEEQIKNEISQCIKLIFRIYKTFGFSSVDLELSTRPEDSMGSDEIWDKSTQALREALAENKINFEENVGGGAFYGPKIDFHIKDCLNRSWQCGTIQLDFSMPERFDLVYIGPDGAAHRPVMIHRACFGSLERFLGILIEHYGGAFPLWLAPIQVRVSSISEKQEKYAQKVFAKLSQAALRTDLDISSSKISYKVREAEVLKIPYLVVVGEKEMTRGNISCRGRGRKDLGTFKIDKFIKKLKQEIKEKKF